MRDDKLSVQSMDFAVSIVNLVKYLKQISSEQRSDFIALCAISLKLNIHCDIIDRKEVV